MNIAITDGRQPFTISGISATYVKATGGDTIVINGSHLNKVDSVLINGRTCTGMSKTSSQIFCTTPSNLGVGELADITMVVGNDYYNFPDQLSYVGILGQSDTISIGYIDRVLANPRAVYEIGGKLLVSDFSNSRILIYNSVPNSPVAKPDLALGQPHPAGIGANFAGLSASSFSGPLGIWSDGTKLAVADFNNHRVLIWNTFPTISGQPADLVLGQPTFTSNTANNGPGTVACGGLTTISQCTLNNPYDVNFAGGKLYVSDFLNNRILVWDSWPTTNQQPADHVLGQPNFTTSTLNNGPAGPSPCGAAASTTNACSVYRPTQLWSDGTKFAYAELLNNRVLIFNSLPVNYGDPADVVLGQADVNGASSNAGPGTVACGGAGMVAGLNACSLSQPTGISSNGSNFYVSDQNNNRVLGWSTFPTSHQQPADIVLGQNSFFTGTANKGQTAPSQDTIRGPYFMHQSGTRLYLADQSNHRILIYSPLPTTGSLPTNLVGHANYTEADVIIYQKSIGTGLVYPSDVVDDGTHLIIADRYNHRVIIQPSASSLSDVSQRVTLGQPDHTSGIENNGPNTAACDNLAGRNRCSLNFPAAVLKVGNKLVVSDYSNNRVLIWNTIPTTNQQPADLVLGQPNFISGTSNNGVANCGTAGVNQCTLSLPIGLASNGTNLIVSDYNANRILIWNVFPTSIQQPADVVLGQPNFISSAVNNGPAADPLCDNSGGINRCSLSGPSFLTVSGTKLIASDGANNRILIWDGIPTNNQEAADVVVGQTNFTSALTSTISAPQGVCVLLDGRLVISDARHNRLLIFNSVPTSNSVAYDTILGQSSSTAYTIYAGTTPDILKFHFPYGLSCRGTTINLADSLSSRIQVIPLLPQ